MFLPRFRLIVLTIAAAMVLSACASRISALMPEITTLDAARRHFGPPASVQEIAGGSVRHEWQLDRSEQVPGQYVIQRIYIGHDSDGYREYIEREVWVPWHRRGPYCLLVIITDSQGRVLNSTWQGNSCDSLIR